MSLTERERQVLCMFCLPNKEIAQRLCITLNTVKSHVHKIMQKIACDNRAITLLTALKNNIIELKDVVIG